MEISVVIPVRNEAGNIMPLLLEISKALRGISYEVIFVDDSTDETPDVIQKAVLQSAAPITLEHREGQSGLSSAVIRGFSLAKGEFVAVMDADLQHPPSVLRSMYCAMLEGADMCIPSRFIPGGKDGGLKGLRGLISATARWMGKLIVKKLRPLSDPTSGLFMVRRKLLLGADLRPIGWKIMAEVTAVCPCYHIIEIPYAFQSRNSGKSKISMKVTMQYIKQLFSLVFRQQNEKRVSVNHWTTDRVDYCLEELEHE
ncbi:glycosyl transferase [Clostridium sp. W14A]|nr:glycosyl transferase [Clostridium sp. W14A]